MLLLHLYGRRERVRHADAIVVLGSHVNAQGVAGSSLRNRTLKAVELYRRGYAANLICTGGVGDNPPAESVAAREVALQQGVPEHAIHLEDRSISTWTNLALSQPVCREHDWKKIILVSDPYHLWRASRYATKLDFDAFTAPTDPCYTNPQRMKRLRGTAREAFCVLRDIFWRRSISIRTARADR